ALVLVDTIYSIHGGHAKALSLYWVLVKLVHFTPYSSNLMGHSALWRAYYWLRGKGDEEREDTRRKWGEFCSYDLLERRFYRAFIAKTTNASNIALQHKEASRQTYNKTSNPIKYCVCRQREAPNELT
ncbi:13756_t:CDS:2, partial [Acaulospora colombiana]